MIAAPGLVNFTALALVDPSSSTVQVDGSCPVFYPRKSKSASLLSLLGKSNATLLQCRVNLRSERSCRNWQNLHISKFRSSISGLERLVGFKDDGNWNCRSRRGLDIRSDGCRDYHEHDSPDEEEFCEPHHHKKDDCTFKNIKTPKAASETGDLDQGCMLEQSGGYTIHVSKELMGVFRYVEKVKRARTRDLAETLRKVSQACFLFSCVRGVLAPLVEVYKTSPPNWKNLLYMVGTFDSFALSYLAMRASEPLFQLSALATETDCDMMGSIKKEEEHLLALAIELVKLFRRLRNVTLFIALTQLVQVIIQLRDPAFSSNIAKIFGSWFECPWGGS